MGKTFYSSYLLLFQRFLSGNFKKLEKRLPAFTLMLHCEKKLFYLLKLTSKSVLAHTMLSLLQLMPRKIKVLVPLNSELVKLINNLKCCGGLSLLVKLILISYISQKSSKTYFNVFVGCLEATVTLLVVIHTKLRGTRVAPMLVPRWPAFIPL